MAAIRKREWTNPAGKPRSAWLVDYVDAQGKRRAKQFRLKKDAESFVTGAAWEIRNGTHTADSASITVEKASKLWLARAERDRLEQSTIAAYRQHAELHIKPYLGSRRLSQLTRPMLETYRDELLDSGRSRAMVSRVLRSLSSIISEAERLGYVAKNPCRDVRLKRAAREKARVQPPSKADMRSLIDPARAHDNQHPAWLPMLLVLNFAGLRASELRALPWQNVDLVRKTITIDRRADFQNVIGPPKSAAGWRTIPLPDMVVLALKAWKCRCPASQLDLVFPSRAGTPIYHPNLVVGFQEPLQIAAGITRPAEVKGKPKLNVEGDPALEGRHGLHDFRHAAASLWIERRVPPKRCRAGWGTHPYR